MTEAPRDLFGKLRKRLQRIQTLDPRVRGGVAQHVMDLGDRSQTDDRGISQTNGSIVVLNLFELFHQRKHLVYQIREVHQNLDGRGVPGDSHSAYERGRQSCGSIDPLACLTGAAYRVHLANCVLDQEYALGPHYDGIKLHVRIR